MPFVKHPGLRGKVYVPDNHPDAPKKNPCPDCFHCQMCSDDRCQVCLDNGNKEHGKEDCQCEKEADRNENPCESKDISEKDPDTGAC